jgi:hypothetical protein
MRNVLLSVVLVACSIVAAGCTSYYRITDPTTGRAYYTTKVDEQRGGGVTFKDERTGNNVTVQNSEVKKVTKEEYESGRYTAPSTSKQ